uniref:Uncharacterized protein n=1 Tax=Rhodopseudomonas palustris (strain BisA53) TaxID=316055 RepID=Q07H69_RHOP5
MISFERRRAYKRDLLLAALMIAAGLAVAAASLQFAATDHSQLAQATQPLQSTPGAESKPTAPDAPPTTGTGMRPREIAPEPARPDAEAQDAGATPALPPAPAEKTGDPIPTK